MPRKKEIVIRAKTLYDGLTKKDSRTIVVSGTEIVEVTSKKLRADYEGFVTPALIDAHSHIGMVREGEPAQENETNDFSDQILPLVNPLNGIYFDDRAFTEAVDFGVLYSCVVPGSGNLLGGRAMIIKNFAQSRSQAVVKDYGYKMALGYNPRSTTDWKGSRPNTRMGIYALLEKRFDDVLQKKDKAVLARERKLHELRKKQADKDKKLSADDVDFEASAIEKEYALEFSSEERALLELLSGEKTAKVHVHKHEDVLYLIELSKKYGLKLTADHTCDVFSKEIFDELGDHGIPVVYGPIGSLSYKVELKHAYYQNVAQLMKSRAFYGLMSDHPVILTTMLRDTLKFFLIQGLSDAEAISLLTYRNAKILGLDDRLGTIAPGKLASLVVWDKDPINLGAFPRLVLGEGQVLRERA